MEYEQVAPDLNAACLHEDVVGETDCAYEVGVVHKVFTHELVAGSVGYAPRCNESKQSALVEQFHCLYEKVVVYGFGGLFMYAAFLPHVCIEHTEIAEWYV